MEDLSERLLTHFVGGRWRVPFATGHVPVLRPDGRPAGAVVMAGPHDVARAVSALRGADDRARLRLADALAPLGLAEAVSQGPDGQGPAILLADAQNRTGLGAALGAGIRHGVIWCPPLEAALFATELAQRLQQADLPPGAFALIHTHTPQTEAHLRATGLAVLGPDHR